MKKRPVVVVDIETSGLDPDRHDILEVAAKRLDLYGDQAAADEIHFFPALPADWLERAELGALATNKFIERRGFELSLGLNATREAWGALDRMLGGATFAGVNPHFDSSFIKAKWATEKGAFGISSPRRARWDYHLLDLGSMAVGALGLDPCEMPSAAGVFERLGVVNEDSHTALGDVRATAAAFRALAMGGPA